MPHHRPIVSAAPADSAVTAAAATPLPVAAEAAIARAAVRRRVPAITSVIASAAAAVIAGTALLPPSLMPAVQASPLRTSPPQVPRLQAPAMTAVPQVALAAQQQQQQQQQQPVPPATTAAAPPAAPVRQPVKPRPNKVFLSGENPWIDLHDTPDGPTVTEVSFWRIHWSPVGTGHVCFVILGEEQAPDTVRIALYDNRQLLDYLTRDVLGSYNKSYIDRPFTPVGDATFARQGDARATHRETCRAKGYDIELSWHTPREPGLIDILPGSRPTNPFGITYLRIPVERAEVRVNGKPARGRSLPGGSFLAFGETWIK